MLEHRCDATFVPPTGNWGHPIRLDPVRQPMRTKDGYISIAPLQSIGNAGRVSAASWVGADICSVQRYTAPRCPNTQHSCPILFWPAPLGRLTLMILGIGNDLCDVERMASVIQRHGQRFLERTFTQAEQALAQRRSEPCLFYAGRFAAKEAFMKALGTGIIEQVHWTDIEILASRSGQPIATISGGTLTRLRRLADRGSDTVVHVSISHDARLAIALVILEARNRLGGH